MSGVTLQSSWDLAQGYRMSVPIFSMSVPIFSMSASSGSQMPLGRGHVLNFGRKTEERASGRHLTWH